MLQNISDEKFDQLINALPDNEHLEVLSLTNVGLTDRTALLLAEVIEKSKTLRVLNVETNFISPPVIVTLVKALLKAKSVEEFRASNQVRIHFSSNTWLPSTKYIFDFSMLNEMVVLRITPLGDHINIM